MGATQSASVSGVSSSSTGKASNPTKKEGPLKSRVLDTPIFMDKEENETQKKEGDESFPTPTGHEYDLMDTLAADLPNVIDDESKRQVEEYIEACDNGKGPMVACFSTAEYLSLFVRKHQDAIDLYENTCFRPKTDKSPNGILVDKTKAYPPSCFNMAQMRMTGKGKTKFDRKEGYDLFERGCKGGHGGACYMQAKMLASYPGAMGPDIPYNPRKAGDLLQQVCDQGDSVSCFTLATMLLRGDVVTPEADNVSPQEARGMTDIQRRKNEEDRRKKATDPRVSLKRDPLRAQSLLAQGCERGHAPSCYNMAVMFTQGDDGVEPNPDQARVYQEKTEELVKRFGGFGFGGGMG